MQLTQSRRDFLARLSAAGAAGVLGGRTSLADEGPPETTTIRLPHDPSVCVVPAYMADDLLRAEGFTDVRYVPTLAGFTVTRMAGRGEIISPSSSPHPLSFTSTAVSRSRHWPASIPDASSCLPVSASTRSSI